MQKYGFVYLWYDKKHRRYYVGSHWGHENDGYVCSSRWMRKAYKRRPVDFKRRIISRVSTSKAELLIEEGRWLSMIKPEETKGIRYYNMNICTKPGHWSAMPGYGKTVGEKISASHRANPNWGYWSKGRLQSDETKKKIAKSVSKLMTEEKRQELSEKCSGWSHSKEAKKKIAERNKSKTHKCDACGEYFAPGPFAIHLEWLSRYPVDKYRELRELGLSYRKIAAIHGTDHKNVKKLLEHKE